jgi:starch synthase
MMPSKFEPGGIVQHEFFVGSTPVVATRTGGLQDTVHNYDPKTKKGTGFVFVKHDQYDFEEAISRAFNLY